jgi:hypothetical protein
MEVNTDCLISELLRAKTKIGIQQRIAAATRIEVASMSANGSNTNDLPLSGDTSGLASK